MFEDNRESDCGPGFGFMSHEHFRIKNSTKSLLHINDIIHVLVNVTFIYCVKTVNTFLSCKERV